MQNNDYSLGGEQSGHIILKKYATTGDGLLTAIMITEEICDRKTTLSSLAEPLKLYPQYMRNLRVKNKAAVLSDSDVLAAKDEVEKLIWNYNQKNPSDTYYPSIPQNRFVKNGTKMYFTGSNYREFAVAAGKLAHKQMLNAVKAGRLNIDNPDENDIKLIKKIFTRARKEVRERMSANAKKE
jgi:hypothetical protein